MHYRFNQFAMAVLGALLLFFGAKTIVKIAYEEHEPEKPGYEVSGTEEKPGGGAVKPGGAELATLLAGADPTRGADVAKKCAICHSFDKGGANLIGPNLYGVLGNKIASHEGYEYSPALKAKEGDWDYAMLDHMVENPNAFAPGTKMALFPGLPDAKQRADLIVFLRSKNDNPPPLPEVTAGEEKPSGEAKPGGEKPEAAAGGSEVVALLATADPKQGEADAALCKVCHTFDKGGAALVGPNLYGMVGRKIASVEEVTYTPALKAREGEWTYELLDAWIANPQAFASGTTMAFPGIPDAKKRANIIAFMRSKSDNPAPLPEAAAPGGAPEPAAAEPPAAEPKDAAPEPAATEEAPMAEPEAPAATEEAPAAEPEAAPAEEMPPAAQEEAAPAASQETAPAASEEPAISEEIEKVIEETEDNPPTVSEETPSEPSMGEPPSPSQPQPVYPDEAAAAPDSAAPTGEGAMGEGEMESRPVTTDEATPSMGEPPSPSQPQPVYPDGPPEGAE